MKLFTPKLMGVLILPVIICCGITISKAQQIITIAGKGSSSYSGDGSIAASAELAQPVSVALDASGNIYIADQGNHRIRKVNAGTKAISTVAGSSTAGFSGDGGAATAAQLYYPAGIAVDGSGNIYIADKGNHRIRKVTATTGNISTIAGTGSAGFGGDGGVATAAQLNNPVGVAVDGSGNIYIADQYNQRIRMIAAATGNISTIAGTGSYGYSGDGGAASSATFQNPASVELDGSGNIYVADMFNHVIRKINASTGNISTVAGTGTGGFSGDGSAATSANLNYPSDISFDDSGNLYIAVQFSHRIRKVSVVTGNISTIVATGTAGFGGDWGPATDAQINYPTGIHSDAGGNLYIADRENHRIRFVCNYNVKPTVTSPVNYCLGSSATSLSATGAITYKWFTSATALTGSSTAPIPGTGSAGSTYYYVAAVSPYGCEGPRDSVKVTIDTLPPAPGVTSPVIYCIGATASPLSATGTGLLWYASATGGSGSTTAPTPGTGSTGSTTYYVSQKNSTTGCESPRSSITVTINDLPAAPTASATTLTYCQASSATALSASGTGLLWYTSATGGTGSSTAPVPSTASTGTYYYYVSQTNSCGESSRLMITVIVNPKPAMPGVTSPVSYCQSATSSALSASGSSLKWYTTASGGSGSATAPAPSTSTTGTFYYYVSQTTSGCESDRSVITVTINARPAAPTATSPVTYCVGTSAAVLSATGTSLLWYTAATGGTGSTTAPTPGTSSIGSTTYYVSQTNAAGCESPRKAITVNIINVPAAPTVSSPLNLCEGVTASMLTASGSGLLWHTSATGGSGSSTAPIPGTGSTGSTTYYVSSSNTCGESSRTALVVNVNGKPSAPGVISPVTYCQGDTSVALSATGTSLRWYTSPTGGSGSSTPIRPGTGTSGSFTFYVSQTNTDGCESDREAINVIIKPAPPAPIVSTPVNYCVGAVPSPLSATGTDLLWFTSPTGGLGSTTAPTPSTATAGSATYYVSQGDTSSCRSPRAAITVNVYNTPATPTVSTPVNYCQFSTTTALTASGSSGDTLKWYSAISGGSPSYTAPIPSTTTTGTTIYYVSYSSRFGCGESSRTGITVNVNSKPLPPTISTTPVYYCRGASASPLSASGASLKWYTAATGGTGSPTAPTPSTSSAGTFKYYVSQTSATGCESNRDSIIVIIRNLPVTPTTSSPVVYCQDAAAIPLTVSGIGTSFSALWYTVSSGGTGSATAPTPSTSSTGSTIYYVSQQDSFGCESSRASITVTVNPGPSAPAVSSPVTYCEGATATALTATGSGLLWYTVASGGYGSTTAPVPGTGTPGTTLYYVSQTGSCGESPRSTITVQVNPQPAAPVFGTDSLVLCQYAASAALSPSGTSLKWYSSASGGSPSTTAPTPSTTSTGSTTYYVTQTSAYGCESPRQAYKVTVQPRPGKPTTVSPVEYCSGYPALPLSATGSDLLWYNSASGGTGSATAPTPSTVSTGTTSYYVSQSNSYGCESERESIDVIIYATPTAPTVGVSIVLCLGDTSSPLIATGPGLKWYDTAVAGTPLATAPTPSTATSGKYYYVSQTSSSGCESPRAPVLVNVDTMLSSPDVISPVIYCPGETASSLSATGGSLHWYKDNPSGTFSTSAPTPNTSSPDTIKYYVCRVASSGCEGHKDSILVFINPLPATPLVVSPVTYCYGATALPLTASGSDLKWYTASGGGTGSTTAPTPGTTDSSIHYVSQTATWGCEGPRASIKVRINPLPTAPGVSSPVNYCYGEIPIPLSASGSGLKWYMVSTGGSGSTIAPTPSTTTGGTTDYYVSQTSAEGCEGPRSLIQVQVDSMPAAPIVSSPVIYCQGEIPGVLSAAGGTLHWYTGSATGTYSTTAPTPNTSVADTVKYYVCKATPGGCEGHKDSITVFVNPLPAAPVVTSPISYCSGATALPLTATGSSLKWYSSATGGTGSTTAPIPGTTDSSIHYVSQTATWGCEGPRTSIKVKINPLPTAPIVSTPVEYCKDATAGVLSATGTSLKWYTSASGGSGSTTAPIPATSTIGSTNYYVSQTSAEGCEGPRAMISVNINDLPAPPAVVSPVNICKDAVASALSATGSGLKWYTTATGGSGSSSAPVPSTAIAGSIKYYVSQTSAGGCEGPRDSILVHVRPIPEAPSVVSPVGYCAGDPTSKLIATGSSLYWYTSATGGTSDTATPVPSSAIAGSTTYYVSQTSDYGCESERASITVNITHYPDIRITSPSPYFVYCKKDSVTLKATSSATIASYQWYKDGTLLSGATKDSFRAYSTGLHHVVVYNEYGCKNDTSVYVYGDTLPTPTLSPIDLLFCPNVNIILFCKPAVSKFTYEWYKDGTPVSGSTRDQLIINKPGTYYVKVTDTFGCVENTNISIATTYPVIIRPKILRMDPVLRLDKTFSTYQWYRNGKAISGANTISYTMPSYGGRFWCVVTNENECTEYSDTVDTELSNSIHTVSRGQLKIYPNPAQSKVWIESELPVDVRVTDISGRLIIEQRDAREIDLSDMADGLYMFMIRDKEGNFIGSEKIHKRSGIQ